MAFLFYLVVVLMVVTTPLSLYKIVRRAGAELDWGLVALNCRAGYLIYQALWGPYRGASGFLELAITVPAAVLISVVWLSRNLFVARQS